MFKKLFGDKNVANDPVDVAINAIGLTIIGTLTIFFISALGRFISNIFGFWAGVTYAAILLAVLLSSVIWIVAECVTTFLNAVDKDDD